jgi:hypothetical protein
MSGPDVCQQSTKGSDEDSDDTTKLKCTNMMLAERRDIVLEASRTLGSWSVTYTHCTYAREMYVSVKLDAYLPRKYRQGGTVICKRHEYVIAQVGRPIHVVKRSGRATKLM